MKKISILLICALLLLTSGFAQTPPPAPEFSAEGGIYSSAFYLELSGEGEIYYTTDGSVPTSASKRYTAPIWIPRSNSNSASATIRAVAITDGQSSLVSSNTYYVNSGIQDSIGNVPMVNLVAEPYDLWDYQNGIYTNYNYEHKVPAVFHYITTDGKTEINRNVEIKVSGHGSRSAAKKSLRVYFKKTDPQQSKYLEYNLIPNAGVDYISKATFRISDWQSTNFRDVLAQKIGGHTRLDIAESEPMALFLNGEYWGLYECREQYDNEYLASHHDIDKDNIVYLSRDWTIEPQYSTLPETGTQYVDKIEYSEGPEDGNSDGKLGESYYREQWTAIKSLVMEKDITSPEVYEEFCSKVDIDNFIDYIIVYIYCANDDWPGNNFKFWRVTEEDIDPSNPYADGKWRFMVHDFDIAFESVDHNTLYLSALEKGGVSEARHPAFATAMLDGLLKNTEFRNEFAQRTMVYLSDFMSGESVGAMVDSLVVQREKGKAADMSRWNLGSIQRWYSAVNSLKSFASGRPQKLKNQFTSIINNYYGGKIKGESTVNISSDCEYSVNGAMLSGNKNLSVFANIPVKVTAENARITAVVDGKEIVADNELVVTPQTGTLEISVENRPDCFAIYSVKAVGGEVVVDYTVDSAYEGDTVLYIAGYDKDGELICVTSAEGGKALSDSAAVRYRAFLWDGIKPLCESCMSE